MDNLETSGHYTHTVYIYFQEQFYIRQAVKISRQTNKNLHSYICQTLTADKNQLVEMRLKWNSVNAIYEFYAVKSFQFLCNAVRIQVCDLYVIVMGMKSYKDLLTTGLGIILTR